MKNNSTYAAPNGINPATAMRNLGLMMMVVGGGMARAMVLVTVGNSIVSILYPKYAPMKTNGMDTQHHMAATIRMSRNGTDPEERKKARTVLKKMNIEKHVPGNSTAVAKVQTCHALPRNAL